MAQITNGLVYVENGSASVKSIYELTLSGVVGGASFTVGSEVQWGASGADEGRGYVTSFASPILSVRRKNSGAADEIPALADTVKLVSAPSTTYGTVAQMSAASPPNWSSNVPTSGTRLFAVAGGAPSFYSVTSALADELTLSTVWVPGTRLNAAYSITTDFTSEIGLPTIGNGEVDAASLVNRGFVEIDRRLTYLGSLSRLSANSGTLSAVATTLDFDNLTATGAYDTGAFEATSGDGFFTIPIGVARARLVLQVELSITPSSTVDLSILHSTSGTPVVRTTQQLEIAAPIIQIASPVLTVAATETFKAQITSSNGGTVQNTTSSWFSIESVAMTS